MNLLYSLILLLIINHVYPVSGRPSSAMRDNEDEEQSPDSYNDEETDDTVQQSESDNEEEENVEENEDDNSDEAESDDNDANGASDEDGETEEQGEEGKNEEGNSSEDQSDESDEREQADQDANAEEETKDSEVENRDQSESTEIAPTGKADNNSEAVDREATTSKADDSPIAKEMTSTEKTEGEAENEKGEIVTDEIKEDTNADEGENKEGSGMSTALQGEENGISGTTTEESAHITERTTEATTPTLLKSTVGIVSETSNEREQEQQVHENVNASDHRILNDVSNEETEEETTTIPPTEELISTTDADHTPYLPPGKAEEDTGTNTFEFDLPMYNASLHHDLLLNDSAWAKYLDEFDFPSDSLIYRDACEVISEKIKQIFNVNVTREHIHSVLSMLTFLFEPETEDVVKLQQKLTECTNTTTDTQNTDKPICIQIKKAIDKTCSESDQCREHGAVVVKHVMAQINEMALADQIGDAILLLQECATQAYS